MAKGDYLGEFEQLCLLAVLRLQEDAYGVPVRRELEKCTGRAATVGAVYATLDRLQQKGLVTSDLGDATPERGGRARRYFQVTGEGIFALRRTQQAVQQLMKGLTAVEGML